MTTDKTKSIKKILLAFSASFILPNPLDFDTLTPFFFFPHILDCFSDLLNTSYAAVTCLVTIVTSDTDTALPLIVCFPIHRNIDFNCPHTRLPTSCLVTSFRLSSYMTLGTARYSFILPDGANAKLFMARKVVEKKLLLPTFTKYIPTLVFIQIQLYILLYPAIVMPLHVSVCDIFWLFP